VSPHPAQQQQQIQRQGHQRELSGQYGADDEYDYTGAYMGSDSGSPVVGEYEGGGQGGGVVGMGKGSLQLIWRGRGEPRYKPLDCLSFFFFFFLIFVLSDSLLLLYVTVYFASSI
jgi:hypothetical protein